MGPSALRVAGLQARLKQLGTPGGRHRQRDACPQPEEQPYGEKRARYLDEIAEACKGLAEMVEKTLDEDLVPLVLGGDHSIAVGTSAGTRRAFQQDNPSASV